MAKPRNNKNECPKCRGQKTYDAKTCRKCADYATSKIGRTHTPETKEKLRRLLIERGGAFPKGSIPWNKGSGWATGHGKGYRKTIRHIVLETLGKKCARCGIDDIRVLQVDHVNGGGNKERKLLTPAKMAKAVVDSFLKKENRYQLLCANCNWIKRLECNEEQ